MRYMMIVRTAENSGPPPRALQEAMEKLGEAATKAGAMIANGGLAPVAQSTRIRLTRGVIGVVDGPYTEAKELIGGFALMQFKSNEEAVHSARLFMELHQQHWPGWEGELEVRQVFGPEDAAEGRMCAAEQVAAG